MNQELIDKEIIEQELKEYLDGAYADYGSAKDQLEAFAALVRADEREFWIEQSIVDIEEAIRDEREACAKLVDYWEAREGEHADAIRARGETKL